MSFSTPDRVDPQDRRRLIAEHRIGRVLLTVLALLTCGCAHTSAPVPVVPLRIEQAGDEVELEAVAPEDAEMEEFEPGAGSPSIGVFVGGSGDLWDLDGFVFGLDLGYRLTDQFGVGLFAEGVSGLNRSFATGTQVFWVSPVDIVLFPGVGVERRDSEWEGILRFGIEYEHVRPDGWGIAPSLFYDVGESESRVIYGVTLGRFF